MKDFFHKYSYSMIKMLLTQIVISIFGLMLSMATVSASSAIAIAVSVFAILFYLFLIYTLVWEIGAKDKISVDVGKKQYKRFTGLWMGLVANIPNIVLAVILAVSQPFVAKSAEGQELNGLGIVSVIANVLQGMYFGAISAIKLPTGKFLSDMWWTYFLIIVPAVVISFLAYYLGHRNFRFFGCFANKKNNTK